MTRADARRQTKELKALDLTKHPAKLLLATYNNTRAIWHTAAILGHNVGKEPEVMDITMKDLLPRDPPCIEDLVFHIQGILAYPPSAFENYSGYQYFGDRLRELKTYMDSRKPRSLSQLWKDSRDSLQWWTFWAVIFVGGASLFLAFSSLAISIAQTVAAFRAIKST